MALPIPWQGRLAVPVIAAPMFLISTPALVIECCRNGVVGTFPALNQRTSEGYAAWLEEIGEALDGDDAPYGVNLVAHSNTPGWRRTWRRLLTAKCRWSSRPSGSSQS